MLSWLWLVAVCISLPTWAATYGNAPTLFNWVSSASHTPVEWTGAPGGLPAACTGGSAAIDDDITAELPIGFTFNFGGTNYTTVRIMSNGRLQFNNTYCYYGTQTVGPPPTYTVPYPNNKGDLNRTIRIYGADLCPAGGGAGCSGTVTYATQGTAPNRSFVVTWNNVSEWNSGSSLFNVQIILYENGEFAFQYKDVSNISGGTGQIGYQLTASDYGLYDTTGITSMAYSAVRFFLPPATWGEYRFDECSGTSAFDSSGNNYTATLTNGPLAASSGALCKGFLFDGSNDYVLLPATFPNMSSSFTITAWIYTKHDWPTGGQKDMRIVTDDRNNNGGFSFSLGDGGWGYDSGGIPAGRLRFYNRSLSPVIFDSPPVIRSNTWYFVAAVTDFGANQRFLSVFDAAGNKLSETAQISTGAWGVDAGQVAIGGEIDGAAGGEGSARWRFNGYIDEVKLFKSPLTANQLSGMALNEGSGYGYDGYQRLCVPCSTVIGRFNVFESSTAAGSINGVIKTKKAGSAFSASSGSLRVVAVNSGGTAIETISPGPYPAATISLLDASNDSQPLDTEACRSSWSTIATESLGTVSLSSSGLATLNPTVSNAYPNVRIRVDMPAYAGPPSRPATYGCSTDNFAIRPATLDVTASDAEGDLNNTGSNVHKAGQPFTLTATALNAANVTTTNYNSTPSLLPGYLILPAPVDCPTCGIGSFSPGTWTASGGILTSTTATYADVGSFGFSVEDRVYAKVDQGDSTKSQRYIGSNVPTVGRFIPDHFVMSAASITPADATGGYSYMNQTFSTTFTLTAMNGLATPTKTYNYLTVWDPNQNPSKSTSKLNPINASWTSTPGTTGFGLGAKDGTTDLTSRLSVVGTPTCTPTTCWTSGEVTVAANLKFARPTTTTADATWGPYEALNLGVAPQDGDGVTLLPAALNLDASTPAGNERQTVGSATKERFGRLQLTNAFGSEMLPLSVPATAQYYNGTNWVINTLDSSTPPAPWAVSPAGSNPLLGGTGNTTPSLGTALVSGVASLSASAPGTGNRGYLDLTVTVPDYLKFFWTGASVTDPTARVTFGIYRGNDRIIYRREVR